MNGCWPKWIKVAPVEYKACAFHDRMYEQGWIDRQKIDRVFLHMMLIEKPDKKLWAYLYYILVRIFWSIYYKK